MTRASETRGSPDVALWEMWLLRRLPPRYTVHRNHMNGNVWSAARLQEKAEGEKASLRKCIRPVMEISSPGHDELRACLSL